MTAERDLRQAICEVGRSLFDRGYVHASAGNISARLTHGYLITPTDACLGRMHPDDIALVDSSGQQRSGRKASKTLELHRAIYDSDPSAQCVIHTHSTHLVALSLQGVWRPDCVLPPITPYQVMKVGPVPLVACDVPGAKRVAQAVAGLIRERPIRGVLLERLGPVVWHTSPESASNVLEELEETARLWLMAQGRVEPLDRAQLAGLREAFGVEWPDGSENPPSFPAARDGGS